VVDNVISGAGGVIHGGGALTLSGANTYSGGTYLTAGTLSISADSNLGAASGGVRFSGGTLRNTAAVSSARDFLIDPFGAAFQTDADLVLSGHSDALSSGIVAKTGTGTLTLIGDADIPGIFQIVAGTLQIGNGGTTGSIKGSIFSPGTIFNLATLVFNRSDNTSYDGQIIGTGTLVKEGSGTLTLTGANLYSGATTVNGGRLLVNGSLGSGR